jgi:flagellar biosynthetic protein FliQ
MSPDLDLAALVRETFALVVHLTMLPLLLMLGVGLLVALFQAITQINEATLSFLPKVTALGFALLLTGGGMLGALLAYTQRIFSDIVSVGLQ